MLWAQGFRVPCNPTEFIKEEENMKRSLRSRVLSVLMALVMVFSVFPANAFAADSDSVTATLVTDVSELKAGDKVIIAAKDSDYALSANQKTNNRGQAAITKDGNSATLTTDVQILTLEVGAVDGTFAFHTGSKPFRLVLLR